jgi:hypothetical protein
MARRTAEQRVARTAQEPEWSSSTARQKRVLDAGGAVGDDR